MDFRARRPPDPMQQRLLGRAGQGRWPGTTGRATPYRRPVTWSRGVAANVGGGNAQHVKVDLGPKAQIVDNLVGGLAGIRLWESE